MRNGKSDSEPGATGARQETFAVEALPPGPDGDVDSRVEQHLQVASRLLSERQAPKAFGELVRASRSLPMTRRLAAALVTISLRAGTEAAAITLLSSSLAKVDKAVRTHVHRQLARVLRRVDQLPRAIEALEAALVAFPDDHGSRRILHELLQRTGKWEALVASLEREAQEAFQRGEYSRAARATRWRARVQAEQMRNLARASEGYGQAANYLEQMGDAVGAFAVRLDGLRVLHASGASGAVLTAAASVCMSAAARLGREAQARQVLEELGLLASSLASEASQPASTEVPAEQPASAGAPSDEPSSRAGDASPPEAWTSGAEAHAINAATRDAGRESPAVDSEAWAAEPEAWVAESEALPVRIKARAAEPQAQAAVPQAQAAEPEERIAEPEARTARPAMTVEMSVPLLEAMIAASSGADVSATPGATQLGPSAPQAAVAQPATTAPESARTPPAEDREVAAPQDTSEDSEPQAGGGALLSELLEIPAEVARHSEPPVAPAEAEAEAEAEEQRPEPEPPAAPASQLWDDPAAQQQLEAQLIAHKAWPELAQFYQARADRAKDPVLRAEVLTRLAELMENELSDPSGAARVYREIVTLTGDREALREQVRLLNQRGDPSLVRRALDEAVHSARTPKARAAAYLTRAERELESGERVRAKADFETAEALTPGMLLVLAGLMRCVPKAEGPMMAHRLRAALAAAPRRSPDRLEALRVLASSAEESLKDLRLAQWAWTEVLAEEPGEDPARARLLELARTLGDRVALSQLLREQLAREPRGPTARLARLELVTALENLGDSAGALTELRHAVRFEPGHKEAWLLLADRLAARGQIGEAAWALEHAATAMEDEADRQRAWVRLATFCRDVLKDPTRAELYARRAEGLRQALDDKSEPPVPAPPRSAIPRRETGTRPKVLVPAPGNVNLTPLGHSIPAPEAEASTDIHPPAPPLADDDAKPTIEMAAVTFPGDKMPFSEEETTANGAPEGFDPIGEPPPPAPPPASAPTEAPLDPSKELDSLLGEEPKVIVKQPESEEAEETGHTSPFLSAWALKRPAALTKPRKAGAPAPERQKAAQQKEEKPTSRPRRTRSSEKNLGALPPVSEQVEAPAHEPPLREHTSPGRRAAMKPTPSAEAAAERGAAASPSATGRRPALAEAVKVQVPTALTPLPRTKSKESAGSAFAQVGPQGTEGSAKKPAPVQNTSIISWVAPPGKMEPVRRLARPRGGTTGSRKALPPEPPPEAEPAVFKKVRERPLDDALYLQIAEYFERRGDPERAALMKEISDALKGREGPPPRPARAPLSPDERSGLRHPLLRSPSGELLACVGVALCRLFPTHGRAAGTREAVHPELGPGAPTALEALAVTQHLLGIQAPEVVLAEDNGPPFSLVFTNSPRLLVGKQAVRQVLPAAELRFYAGRALLCLGPDLLALRSLKKDQVLRGLALLSSALKEGKSPSLEARVLREALSARQLEKAAALYGPATRQFDVSALADAARDSANRAGLIACGAVGPALAALQMKRALEREVVELVRFAASERYFQIRATH